MAASLSSVVSSISSPSLSASSYDLADDSTRSRSSTISTQSFSLAGDSDDEIVWTVSSDYQSESSSSSSTESSLDEDDDEFVILTRPQSPSGASTPLPTASSNIGHLTSTLSNLSLTDGSAPAATGHPSPKSSKGSRRRARARAAAAAAASSPSPPPSPPVEKPTKFKSRGRKSKKQTGLGERPIVDDISEGVSESGASEAWVYEKACSYITSFISNPSAHNNDSSNRLTLLQSLIIEFGLANASMPTSLTAAKALLKSHAFVNVREYLEVRDKGPKAVQEVMHPSRSALRRSIRKKPESRASREWVKDHGLSVLLVTCFR